MSDLLSFDRVTKIYDLPSDHRSLLLRFANLSARAPATVVALSDFDLRVGRGEVVLLMGPNGAGKTTALRLAAGVTYPTSGTVIRSGSVTAVLGVSVGFHPELSGLENLFLAGIIHGMNLDTIRARLDRILAFAGIGEFLHAPVQTYSSGMMMRLGFSVAVHSDFDILAVDETVAVGDKEFRQSCFTKMRELRDEGRALLLATHSERPLRDLGGRVVRLDRGRTVEAPRA